MELSKKIKTFPKKPGVYLMKNVHGKVIYIGKALNLRKRVSDYFTPDRDTRYQVDALMKKAVDLDFIITKNEKEALLLEHSLIQEHLPKYNVLFKDSKRYVSIKVSSYHQFPGIYVTRQTPKDGSTYYGPYISASSCREVVETITSYFKIRTCSDNFFSNRSRPCIQHEINRCTAPCVAYVSGEEYKKQLNAAVMFLKGNSSELLKLLKKEMARSSEEKRYENAAHFRDVINSIKEMIEPQAVSGYKESNKDYIAMYREGDRCSFSILKLRLGKIRDYETVILKNQLGNDDSLWEQFLLQFYKTPEKIPTEILTGHKSESIDAVQNLLIDRKGSFVKIRRPLRSAHLSRIKMAKSNAKESFYHRHRESDWDNISEELMKKLNLSKLPNTVDCVDISNISGQYAVGSLVRFTDGLPDKNEYRRFKITTKKTPDDYAMMHEVLSRRFKSMFGRETGGGAEVSPRTAQRTARRGTAATGPTVSQPDLLLIDGGKGQLAIAKRVLSELGIKDVGLASIAKGKDRKRDEIYIPGRKNPVKMKAGKAHLFLQRIRDEAHRFGIEYYRKRHRKGLVTSELDDIPGLGPAKKKALLKKYGSIDKIKAASVDELSKAPGINKKLAKLIIES